MTRQGSPAPDLPDWAMPLDVVQSIFACMAVRYGTLWTGRIGAVDESLVIADWARGLAGFTPTQIRHALDHLPDDSPPLLGQFKGLCAGAPRPAQPQIPERVQADPARVGRELQRMADTQAAAMAKNRLQWAHDLQERDRAERLTEAQRRAYIEALAHDTRVDEAMPIHLIPVEALPPAMRCDETSSNV